MTVSTADDGERITITVADLGPGVADTDREHVFERGWRGAQSRGVRPSGSGLGLTIVRQVAEAHGGSVDLLENDVGMGTRFELSLPVRQP